MEFVEPSATEYVPTSSARDIFHFFEMNWMNALTIITFTILSDIALYLNRRADLNPWGRQLQINALFADVIVKCMAISYDLITQERRKTCHIHLPCSNPGLFTFIFLHTSWFCCSR